MKTKSIFEDYLYFVLFTSIIFISGNVYAQEAEEHRAVEKFEQWFMGQRMSPLDTIRKDAYSDAVEIGISLNQFNRSNPGPDEWIPLGPQPGECSYGGEISGRVQTVFYHPTQSNTIFIGGANGGVIKSTNGGTDWEYKYNGLTSLSSGCITIDPNNPSYMYYGTGEGGTTYAYYGRGIYYSHNGGETWQLSSSYPSLDLTQVNKIVVNPFNSAELMAAVSAHSFNDLNAGGIYRSSDYGVSWVRIFPDPAGNFGLVCSDIAYSPTTEDKIYALGPMDHSAPVYWDNGVDYRISTNGGLNFSDPLNTILPVRYRSKITISSDGNTIYAVTADYPAGEVIHVYKSINGGNIYTEIPEPVDESNWGAGQAYYNMCISVSPDDAELLFVGISNLYRSTNGGSQTYRVGGYVGGPHPDFHGICFNTNNEGEVLVGCDGGIWKSTNYGASGTWINLNHNLNLTQFYRVSSDPYNPGKLIGGSQDNGMQTRTTSNHWSGSHVGDFGKVYIDQINPSYVIGHYANCGNGCPGQNPTIYSVNGGTNYSTSAGGLGSWDNSVDWLMPIVPDVVNPGVYYLARRQNGGASNTKIFKSTNYGAVWENIPLQQGLDGKAIENIAVSESNPQTIYASYGFFQSWSGTQHGLYKSINGGASWDDIEITSKGAPNKYISSIKVNPQNADEVYITYTGFDYTNNEGHVYKTTNGGATNWIDITGNLGDVPVNDLVFYYVDCNTTNLIAATDIGVVISDANNINWTKLGTNLPPTVSLELNYEPLLQKIRAGTHGRGVWEYDLGGTIYVKQHLYIGGNIDLTPIL